jgi:hypothetical protein
MEPAPSIRAAKTLGSVTPAAAAAAISAEMDSLATLGEDLATTLDIFFDFGEGRECMALPMLVQVNQIQKQHVNFFRKIKHSILRKKNSLIY